jgi:hypothetical protein
METPCPSGTDLGGGCNASPFRVNDGKVGEIWLQVAFPAASAQDERRGMTPWSSVGAPPLHVGECVPLGHAQAHAVSPDSYGPTIVSVLDEEGCRC